ncbi:MAG: RNA methyltransferase [Polyangiaceae bacterium]|nr:RNA methyltransferase [Polyangiaceae bacterium]
MAARLVTISSVDAANATPFLYPYVGVRERDLLRGNGDGEGLFIAEGEVVVRVLVMRSPFTVRSLLIETRRIETLRDVIDALPESVSVYVAPQGVLDGIVGFPIHRGVLGLGVRGPATDPSDLLATGKDKSEFNSRRERIEARAEREEPAQAYLSYVRRHRSAQPTNRFRAAGCRTRSKSRKIVIGLVGLANHDNVGSIFRNAAAFGVQAILLDNLCCDPLYRKSIRVSVGGALMVPFARCASAEVMLDILEDHGWEPIALSPRGERELRSLAPVAKRALLLGTEGEGLPETILRRAQRVRIDMQPTLDSLNVAVTSGIALYEATRS